MKHFLSISLVLIIFLTNLQSLYAQCDEDITLSSQAEVDNFSANYDCEQIDATLKISGDDINNLNGLNGISYIKRLSIENNQSLQNLNGIDNIDEFERITITNNINLQTVIISNTYLNGSKLDIYNNDNLTDINISDLKTLDGFIEIYNNNALKNLSVEVDPNGCFFRAYDNPALESISLNFDGEYIYSAIVRNNPMLTNLSISGATIGDYLTIDANQNLENLNNINVQQIDELTVANNSNLSTCCLPPEVLENTTDRIFENNAAGCNSIQEITETCNGKSFCDSNEGITLTTQAEVDNFSATYGCEKIEGTLTISGDDITNLNGLSTIELIEKGLTIENNPMLHNLEGLENIIEIFEELTINNNSSLLNIDAISVKKIKVGSLIIKNNDALSHLPDFENVKVYLDIIIENNFALQTLLLDSIGIDGALCISENTNLNTILINRIYLDCNVFRINDNPNLTDIKTTGIIFTEDCTAKIYNNGALKNASFNISHFSNLKVYNNLVLEELKYNFEYGYVSVTNNPALTNIRMLGYEIGVLNIDSNQSLENIGYFDIDEVRNVTISNNSNLKNIDSLFNIEKITSSINITNNSNLANCCLLPDWLDRIGAKSEKVNISQNKEGCNSIANIETSCTQPNFENFPWLNNIVDLNNCCNNQTVTQYTNGHYSYIYIEADDNCENTENRLYYKGRLFCERADNFCYNAYKLQNFEDIVLYNCNGDTTKECLANAGELKLLENNFICEGEDWLQPYTVEGVTENEAYDYLFFLTDSEGNIFEVSTMQSNNFTNGRYFVYGVSYLVEEGLNWSNGNIGLIKNNAGLTSKAGACIDLTIGRQIRYFNYPEIDLTNTTCNNNGTFTVELSTSNTRNIRYGENFKNSVNPENGIVILTLSTNSAPHYLRAYGFSDAFCEILYEINTPKECNENLPNFEDFPWLEDLVDLNNCCNNQTVTQYTNGHYSYIYIETDDNCENTDNRLYYKGQLFCERANNFCYNAYKLQNLEAITLWSCENNSSKRTSSKTLNESTVTKIYPNPVQQTLNIQTAGFNIQNLQIEIADFTGRIIETIQPKTGKLQLETSHLKAGNYLLYLNDGAQSAVEKFVKID